MLPEHLSSSYDKYKKDTNFFLTWLAKNAKACGYHCQPSLNPPESSVPIPSTKSRLKGKARKKAKIKAANALSSNITEPSPIRKHVLSTKELLIQAKVVANSTEPLIKIPEIVQRLLSEAIAARKRCSAWFHKMNEDGQSTELDESNSSHEHFILVLEKAFELLKPRFETPQHLDDQNGSGENERNGVSPEDVTNQFEGLKVEDIDEASYDAMPSVKPATPANSTSKSTDLVYELELAETAELASNLFCLFEDLNHVRDFLRRVWEKVALGIVDYMTASLTTNVALELIRTTEETLIKLASQHFDDDSYRAATSLIHTVPQLEIPTKADRLIKVSELKARMENGDTNELIRHSPRAGKAEFVFLSTFYTLWKVTYMTRFQKKYPTVTTIGRLYLFNEDVCPGNPHWMHEDELLSQILLDLGFKFIPDRVTEQAMKASRAGWLPKLADQNPHPRLFPVQDEITNGLQNALLDEKITISAVFKARILLDIALTMGAKQSSDCYLNLRQMAATADSTLDIAWSRDKKILKLRAGCVPTQQQLTEKWVTGTVGQQAMQLSYHIKTNIKESVRAGCKMDILKENPLEDRELPIPEAMAFNFHGLRSSDIQPAGNPTFYFECHPVYCGLERLRLEIGLQKLGLNFANASGSVATVAHLYNTCQQQQLLNSKWNQMEGFIRHNIRSLFKGEFPETTQQIINRFGLCLKVPLAIIAGFRPNSDPIQPILGHIALKNANKMLNLSEVWTILDEYFDKNGSGEKLLSDILKLAKANSQGNAAMTAFELLPHFLSYIHEAVQEVDIYMITLTRNCTTVLLNIRKEFKKQFGIPHMLEGEDIAKYVPEANVETVMQVLLEEKWLGKHDGIQGPRKTGTGELRKLEVAAKVIEDFIPEANTTIQVEPFDIIASYTVDDEREYFSEKEQKKWHKILTTEF